MSSQESKTIETFPVKAARVRKEVTRFSKEEIGTSMEYLLLLAATVLPAEKIKNLNSKEEVLLEIAKSLGVEGITNEYLHSLKLPEILLLDGENNNSPLLKLKNALKSKVGDDQDFSKVMAILLANH